VEELYEGKYTQWRNYMKENAHTAGTRETKMHGHRRNYMKENTHTGGTR
jgi:hypothetical protein